MESSPDEIQQRAERAGRRAFGAVLVALAALFFVGVLGAVIVLPAVGVGVAETFGGLFSRRRADGCDGCRLLAPGARVVRDGRDVARLQQVAEARSAERPLPAYLAAGTGPALDSLRAGELVARLAPSDPAAPVIELVARGGAPSTRQVGTLILTSGGPPLPLYGPAGRVGPP